LERCQPLCKRAVALKDVLGDIMIIASMSHQWEPAITAVRQYIAISDGQLEHDEAELSLLDTRWQVEGFAPCQARAIECARCRSASTEHRVGAVRLLLTMAHERCDRTLGLEAFNEVADLLDPTTLQFAQRLVPVYYDSVFGDQDKAFAVCTEVTNSLGLFSMHERMRVASNVAASLAFIGAYDHTVQLARDHYALAQRVGAKTWIRGFGDLAAAGYIMLEDFREAASWFRLARRVDETSVDHDAPMTTIASANDLELALAAGDTVAAGAALSVADRVPFIGCRWEAYRAGGWARLRLIQQPVALSSQAMKELYAHYERVKHFACCDGLVTAMAESLSRREDREELRALLVDYAHARRERSALPPSLERIRLRLENPPIFESSDWASRPQLRPNCEVYTFETCFSGRARGNDNTPLSSTALAGMGGNSWRQTGAERI
jgi:hypothetical protein